MKRDTSVGRDLKHDEPFLIVVLSETDGQVAVIPHTQITSTLNEERIEGNSDVKAWFKFDPKNRIDAIQVLVSLHVMNADAKWFTTVSEMIKPQPVDIEDFMKDRNLSSTIIGHDDVTFGKKGKKYTKFVIDEYHITATDSTITGTGITIFEGIVDFIQKSMVTQ